jgi:hypothetical protein
MIKSQHKNSENAVMFKYLGMTLTNQNLVHQEIKSRLNPWDVENVCYNSVQNLLSSHLLSKNIKI